MYTLEELRKLDLTKVREEIRKAEKDLFKIKFEVISDQSKSNHLIAKNKKYIAQMRTILGDGMGTKEDKPTETTNTTKS